MPSDFAPESLPNATHSGYLDVDTESGSAMFFVFYEAQAGSITEDTPILVWLQVGALPVELLIPLMIVHSYRLPQ